MEHYDGCLWIVNLTEYQKKKLQIKCFYNLMLQ